MNRIAFKSQPDPSRELHLDQIDPGSRILDRLRFHEYNNQKTLDGRLRILNVAVFLNHFLRIEFVLVAEWLKQYPEKEPKDLEQLLMSEIGVLSSHKIRKLSKTRNNITYSGKRKIILWNYEYCSVRFEALRGKIFCQERYALARSIQAATLFARPEEPFSSSKELGSFLDAVNRKRIPVFQCLADATPMPNVSSWPHSNHSIPKPPSSASFLARAPTSFILRSPQDKDAILKEEAANDDLLEYLDRHLDSVFRNFLRVWEPSDTVLNTFKNQHTYLLHVENEPGVGFDELSTSVAETIVIIKVIKALLVGNVAGYKITVAVLHDQHLADIREELLNTYSRLKTIEEKTKAANNPMKRLNFEPEQLLKVQLINFKTTAMQDNDFLIVSCVNVSSKKKLEKLKCRVTSIPHIYATHLQGALACSRIGSVIIGDAEKLYNDDIWKPFILEKVGYRGFYLTDEFISKQLSATDFEIQALQKKDRRGKTEE